MLRTDFVDAWALLLLSCAGCPTEPEPTPALPTATWHVAHETSTDEGAFLSVWGDSPADVWAVGGQVARIGDAGAGLAYRRRDGAWSRAELPAGAPLLNWVHGHEDELWIVGNAGAAFRHTSEGWVSSLTGVDVPLWGCWVVAKSDVWAVGGDAFDPEGQPVIVHWDGTTWEAQALPVLDRPASALFKVWAAAADDVWAVGDAGVILHHDGAAWAQVSSGTGNDLISLWGRGPHDVLAVGGRSIGTLARWDGSTWTTQDIGEVAGINGVWMHASGDAAIAGNIGALGVVRGPGFVLEREDVDAGLQVLHGVLGFEDGSRVAVGGSLDRSPPYTGLIVETD